MSTIILKHPVHPWEKTLKAKSYNLNSRFRKSYGYLEVGDSVNGRANPLKYYILLTSNAEMIRVPIAIHYLYDMLLFRGQYRPVARQSNKEDFLWLNERTRVLNREKAFNQMLPDELHKVFQNALGSLGDIIQDSPEKEQIIARHHHDNLAMVEWKADLYYKTYNAVNFLKNPTL